MANLPKNYVRRLEWGAQRPASKPTILLASRVDAIVYHYTAAGADEQADHKNCAGRVRGVQAFHQNTRGWNDIAYNFLTCKHGYIFEGRGIENKSAATGADNDHTLAVCFLGDDSRDRDDITNDGRTALVEITRWIRQRRPAVRYSRGHRDFMSTSCPGDEVYGYIRSSTFERQVTLDDAARLAALRKWILARHAEGWGWARIKASPNWREFVRRGGK
jgi:hypothetical protein